MAAVKKLRGSERGKCNGCKRLRLAVQKLHIMCRKVVADFNSILKNANDSRAQKSAQKLHYIMVMNAQTNNRESTMRKISKAAEAKAKYNESIDANIEMLERMVATLKAEKKATTQPNWGDVADQGHYRENIREVCDCMHNEGEYAPEEAVSSKDSHTYTVPTFDRFGRIVK